MSSDWAIDTIAVTIADEPPPSSPATNVRSIFSPSSGKRSRYDSDEKPVPKSSRIIRTPSAFSAWSVSTAASVSSISTDSVISIASSSAPSAELVHDGRDVVGHIAARELPRQTS